MLNNEERNLLVKTYKEMPDAAKLAKVYNISASSVYRLVRQMKDEGSVDLKVGNRGRKPSRSPEDVDNIRRTVLEKPDITIREINARLNPGISDETVRTKVAELGLRYKKRSMLRNRNGLTFRTSGNSGVDGRKT